MSQVLPINVDGLLHCRAVESVRVEFKGGWDSRVTGYQVLKTICGFANDLQNLNGGYVVLGVADDGGAAVLPPLGLSSADIDAAQKWIRGNCNRIDPVYQPVMSPEVVEDRHILVVWVPPSDTRPHSAPDGPAKSRKYWIRLGSETVDAEANGVLQQLLALTARVPWDDRRASQARVQDLREAKVREYLQDVRSGLLSEPEAEEIYRRMRITVPANDHEIPRNVGLLFFSDEPRRWFPGAWIEVVQFAADRAGDVQEERVFRGSLVAQLHGCLDYLQGLSAAHLQKEHDRSQVRGWVSYPLRALRETLVNAVYHRSYQPDAVEPTKVYFYPDRMEIVSYPGPVQGIEHRHLEAGATIPPAPPRNRRVGDFLKELGLAEQRLTGLPTVYRAMADNGSPVPRFDFDEGRTYFRATLPAHPEYSAISALRDAAHLRALGDDDEAFRRLESAWNANQASAVLAAEMIRLHAGRDSLDMAKAVLENFTRSGPPVAVPHVTNVLIEALSEGDQTSEAQELLDRLPGLMSREDAVDAAILAKRLRKPQAAHRYFEQAGEAVFTDPRALHEFAQTKMWLAQEAKRNRRRSWRYANQRLLRDARGILERVTQLDASRTRHAWAWRDLARTLNWLRAPVQEIEDAYARAMKLLPGEQRFMDELRTFRDMRQDSPGSQRR